MPLFESICSSGHWFEWYASTRDKPDPPCRECGEPTKRLISRFGVIWTKGISDYGDPKRETYHADMKRGGHWVARKRSRGGTDAEPIREFIQTRQQQREYCKEEGLIDPTEVGQMEVSADGQAYSSRGLPGAWA